MKKIDLRLKENSYKIVIGRSILKKIGSHVKELNLGKDAIIITNPIIKKIYGRTISSSLKKSGFSVKIFEVPDGEKSKSAKVAFDLIEKIALYDVMKRPFVVALGGGVIGDLAGYVAAAYKRGIPYIQVPTTFLAQIDSAIGGKVAIDLPIGKNLVGAFYQPKMVFSDVSVLGTLSDRQIKNGLAEAVKYGIISDRKLFDLIDKNCDKLIDLDLKILEKVVAKCSSIKARVVSQDEKETKGLRAILNFGHTIGHAVETAVKYNVYQHGEAVALGMRVAAEISYKLGMLEKKDVELINKVITNVGLPLKIKKAQQSDILRIMQHDKKFITGKNRFVLATNIGKVKVVEGVPMQAIKAALKIHLSNI